MSTMRLSLLTVVLTLAGLGRAEAPTATWSRAEYLAAVVRGNPGLAASQHREHVSASLARADSSLPPPELMAEALQVPVLEPWNLPEAAMLQVGIKQTFPAGGALEAKAEARTAEARAEAAARTLTHLTLLREAAHAWVELAESRTRHALHGKHVESADRIVAVAQARLAAGARLTDVALAERERSMLLVELSTEAANTDRARLRLMALARSPLSSPAPAATLEPEFLAPDATDEALLSTARKRRPEGAAFEARLTAQRAMEKAMQREASVPGWSARVGYFAPTRAMPFHGFGVSLGLELPWAWGGKGMASRAQGSMVSATSEEARDAAWRVEVELVSAAAQVRTQTARLSGLTTWALPAARKAEESALAAYASGQGELMVALEATRSRLDLELEEISTRAMVAHALVDLDWALGTPAPRVPATPPSVGEHP